MGTGNYFQVQHKVIESNVFKGLSWKAKLLYFILCKLKNRFQRRKNYFSKSDRALMRETGMSHSSVKRAKVELMESCLVTIVTRPGGRTRYCIHEIDG